MWLRDSANQLQSYKSLITSTSTSNEPDIASLFRGAINLQARYIRQSPYCNAFHPPAEAKFNKFKRSIAPRGDNVRPKYDPEIVFECKYELDSLAAFLQLSWDYYEESKNEDFFRQFGWVDAVRKVIKVARTMQNGTYAADGSPVKQTYKWLRNSDSASETMSNRGYGPPMKGGIGLVRSFFRPSDDACIYQYFIPANMMLARYLSSCAEIMRALDKDVADEMESIAAEIEIGINEHAIVQHPKFGEMYAYEIDGFGSYNLMVSITTLKTKPHTNSTISGRCQPSIPPQHPPHGLQARLTICLQQHTCLCPQRLKSILLSGPCPQRHGRTASWAGNGLADGSYYADSNEQ